MSLDFLDSDDWEPAAGEHPTWSMEEIENHPLFMNSISPDSKNEHIDALQSVLYDEETPYGLCHNFKEQGNEALKRGFIKDAIVFYTEALNSNCEDVKLLSQVHSNLALAYLKVGDLPKCADECYRAVGLNPENVKAFFRGAKASQQLELYSQAIYFAKGGLDIEPENVELQKLLSEVQFAREEQEEARRLSAVENSTPSLKFRWRD
jgi:tetratricopeptide (TPR) repeat protein